jgi:hypothetical protein
VLVRLRRGKLVQSIVPADAKEGAAGFEKSQSNDLKKWEEGEANVDNGREPGRRVEQTRNQSLFELRDIAGYAETRSHREQR